MAESSIVYSNMIGLSCLEQYFNVVHVAVSDDHVRLRSMMSLFAIQTLLFADWARLDEICAASPLPFSARPSARRRHVLARYVIVSCVDMAKLEWLEDVCRMQPGML